MITGLCNSSAQTMNARDTIERLARDAGSRLEAVKRIPIPPSKESAAVDDWLARNRESIEGTRGGPFNPTSKYVMTFSGNRIYVHVLDWNGTDKKLPCQRSSIGQFKRPGFWMVERRFAWISLLGR
jgi:hypothetical protein